MLLGHVSCKHFIHIFPHYSIIIFIVGMLGYTPGVNTLCPPYLIYKKTRFFVISFFLQVCNCQIPDP